MQKFSYLSLVITLCFGLLFTSCKKDPVETTGCTDPKGDNYDANADTDNGSCTYQKRFVGEYTGEFACNGLFATVFSNADVSIIEQVNKNEITFIIQTVIGALPVIGVITKDTVKVDAVIPNLVVNPKDIIPAAEDGQIKVDGKVSSSGLVLSEDTQTLIGVLNLTLTLKEPLVSGGFTIPPGTPFSDTCAFKGTKK